MSPREGRRRQDPRTRTAPSPRVDGRTALLALMVVALTAAVLTLAGTTPRGIGAPVQSFHRAELEQRGLVA